MKKFIKISLIFFIGLTFNAARGQQVLVLSLDSAVTYALDHNKALLNSKYAIDKSVQKIRETVAQGLPQVNATIDYTDYLGAKASLQMSPEAPPATIEFNPTSNFNASISQLIFNGNYYIGVQLAKLARKITEQNYQKEELNVKEQTIQAYYTVLASERIVSIIRENKKNAQLVFEKTNNLANAGIIEPTEAKKLAIMVTSADNALKSIERQVELGYNLLRLQLGLEPDQSIKLTSKLEDLANQKVVQPYVAESFNVDNNMDYKMVSMQGEIARKTVNLTKSSYLPSLVGYYSYTEKIKKPLFDITPKNVLGLTLNIPIFSSGQRWSQLSQAKLDCKISENTKEFLKQQLTVQERQLRYNYNNLYDQYLNQKDNIEIAREVLEKMNLKYEQGIVSSLELTSANNDYLTSETNYTSTLLQLLNAELSIRKINSKL